jgi:hypothetical protein
VTSPLTWCPPFSCHPGPTKFPRLEVVDLLTNKTVLERISAMELLHLDVRDEMERLVAEENGSVQHVTPPA